MSKLKTLIVEDQKTPLKRLINLLATHPDTISFPISTATSFREAEILLVNNKFDVSILDMNLGSKKCFDLINSNNKSAFGIIVLNSIDKEAQQYFHFIKLVTEYLVLPKPYNKDDVDFLIENLKSKNQKLPRFEYLLLKDKNLYIPIKQEDLMYIQVDGNLCRYFYLKDGNIREIVKLATLISQVELLDPKYFIKISEKHIVNMRFVKSTAVNSIILTGGNNEMPIPIPEDSMRRINDLFK